MFIGANGTAAATLGFKSLPVTRVADSGGVRGVQMHPPPFGGE